MGNAKETKALSVSRAESGQKLLNFLQRRVSAPAGDLHRWIRTGQVRVNGARSKAFDRLNEGDLVRVPPFAERLPAGEEPRTEARAGDAQSKLAVVFENEDILVIAKPAGLPVQGGTGHRESVASILAEERAPQVSCLLPSTGSTRTPPGFLWRARPTPPCVCSRTRSRGAAKSGRARISGMGGRRWEKRGPEELRDFLTRDRREQRVKASAHAESDEAREARCVVTPLEERTIRGRAHTLLLIRLITGRTHQIRVQLASRGHPIVGDPWYGNAESAPREGLKLHAFRLSLPLPGGGTKHFELAPPWKGPWRCHPEEKKA